MNKNQLPISLQPNAKAQALEIGIFLPFFKVEQIKVAVKINTASGFMIIQLRNCTNVCIWKQNALKLNFHTYSSLFLQAVPQLPRYFHHTLPSCFHACHAPLNRFHTCCTPSDRKLPPTASPSWPPLPPAQKTHTRSFAEA